MALNEKKILIEIKDLTKSFGDTIVLRGISLTIYENEFVTLLGPSGCGKTTTLRIIGGFESASSGKVLFNGVDLETIPAHKRPSNTVFQKYALFPHMNVFDNIAFGLKVKKLEENIIKEKVLNSLKMVGLSGYENRAVTRLSGGQQQRIAIARALVNEPKVLLLDEPLGALDLKLRKEMQYELKEMQKRTGITFIFVTHDQEEALTMSDKIVIMKDGDIHQVGTPQDIYNDPVNVYVAKFVGESNILEGIVKNETTVEFEGQEFAIEPTSFERGIKVDIVIRPEDIDIVSAEKGQMVGEIVSIIFKGVYFEIDIKTDKRIYYAQTTKQYDIGKKVGISIDPENIHLMEKM